MLQCAIGLQLQTLGQGSIERLPGHQMSDMTVLLLIGNFRHWGCIRRCPLQLSLEQCCLLFNGQAAVQIETNWMPLRLFLCNCSAHAPECAPCRCFCTHSVFWGAFVLHLAIFGDNP